MTRSLATSADGQWAIYRHDRELVTFAAGAGAAVGRAPLDADDVDIAVVGPPTAVAVLTRGEAGATLATHLPPYLDVSARLALAQPMRIAAVTATRLALVAVEGKRVEIVRAAGRALTAQPIEVGGVPEFVVGLERNQLLFGLPRKLEVWDAVSGRPLLRLQLQLPPPPRTVGAAAGHLWVVRPGSDEVFLYRMSDGRPFRHYVGAPIDDVISHPASPLVVIVTPRGLFRLHCFAHSLAPIDAPPAALADAALAQLVIGDDATLLGIARDAEPAEPWHIALGGGATPAAPAQPGDAADSDAPLPTAADRLRAMRGERAAAPRTAGWRETVAAFAQELARGGAGAELGGAAAELPAIAADTELGALAQRLALPLAARRALIVLYAAYLIGEPAMPIATLAQALDGEWSEPLGTGELGAFAMLRWHRGGVALRTSVTELLDGRAPRRVRLAGRDAGLPRAGAHQLARGGRSDAELEAALAEHLGRVATTAGDDGHVAAALLQARLHGATLLALAPPSARPAPWPRDAALVVAVDDDARAAPAWLAELRTPELI